MTHTTNGSPCHDPDCSSMRHIMRVHRLVLLGTFFQINTVDLLILRMGPPVLSKKQHGGCRGCSTKHAILLATPSWQRLHSMNVLRPSPSGVDGRFVV